jgi:LytTr DNA-binding domain
VSGTDGCNIFSGETQIPALLRQSGSGRRERRTVTDSRTLNQTNGSPLASLARRWSVIACVTFISVIAGPFGTFHVPLPSRILFWAALIVWNGLKWELWAHILARHFNRSTQAYLTGLVLGPLLLNATVPLEIEFAYAAIGRPVDLPMLTIWGMASATSVAISLTVYFISQSRHEVRPSEPVRTTESPTTPPLTGLLRKGGVLQADDLHAIIAEDHFVRLYLADGRQPLIFFRFGDALLDVAGFAGDRVHRGAWVAAHAVTGAHREGRNWRLHLENGVEVPVGGKFLANVKARGWLAK